MPVELCWQQEPMVPQQDSGSTWFNVPSDEHKTAPKILFVKETFLRVNSNEDLEFLSICILMWLKQSHSSRRYKTLLLIFLSWCNGIIAVAMLLVGTSSLDFWSEAQRQSGDLNIVWLERYICQRGCVCFALSCLAHCRADLPHTRLTFHWEKSSGNSLHQF